MRAARIGAIARHGKKANASRRELPQGARGFSTTGLNIGGPASGLPIDALASLGRSLFGEGGSSGDDEGGLQDERLGVFLNGSASADFDANGGTQDSDSYSSISCASSRTRRSEFRCVTRTIRSSRHRDRPAARS
jgi:hypothetical protein